MHTIVSQADNHPLSDTIQMCGNISRVSAHAGQNRDVCLSAHGRLPRTLWYV